jgi:hypothetical protein
MSVITCIDCGGAVSTNAVFCPHCGSIKFNPQKKLNEKKAGRIFYYGFAAGALFGVLFVRVTQEFQPPDDLIWSYAFVTITFGFLAAFASEAIAKAILSRGDE